MVTSQAHHNTNDGVLITAAAETRTRTRALRVLRSLQLLLGQANITGMHEIKIKILCKRLENKDQDKLII